MKWRIAILGIIAWVLLANLFGCGSETQTAKPHNSIPRSLRHTPLAQTMLQAARDCGGHVRYQEPFYILEGCKYP